MNVGVEVVRLGSASLELNIEHKLLLFFLAKLSVENGEVSQKGVSIQVQKVVRERIEQVGVLSKPFSYSQVVE